MRRLTKLAKKGWRNVGIKDKVISQVKEHLKVKDRKRAFPRSVPRFITEAVENQIEREKTESSLHESRILKRLNQPEQES
jgi:hypothetical protein